MASKFFGAGEGGGGIGGDSGWDRTGGGSGGAPEDDEVIYKIDIPANLYDLLCL